MGVDAGTAGLALATLVLAVMRAALVMAAAAKVLNVMSGLSQMGLSLRSISIGAFEVEVKAGGRMDGFAAVGTGVCLEGLVDIVPSLGTRDNVCTHETVFGSGRCRVCATPKICLSSRRIAPGCS